MADVEVCFGDDWRPLGHDEAAPRDLQARVVRRVDPDDPKVQPRADEDVSAYLDRLRRLADGRRPRRV